MRRLPQVRYHAERGPPRGENLTQFQMRFKVIGGVANCTFEGLFRFLHASATCECYREIVVGLVVTRPASNRQLVFAHDTKSVA